MWRACGTLLFQLVVAKRRFRLRMQEKHQQLVLAAEGKEAADPLRHYIPFLQEARDMILEGHHKQIGVINY